MTAVTIQGVLLVVVVVLAVAAAIASLTTVLIVRAVRQRRARRREEEERRRQDENTELFGSTGVLALAATLEGVRLATQVAKAGAEVGRSGLAPVVAGSLRKLAAQVETDRPSLRKVVADDGTVTLMFSDIEDSTAINQRLGDEGWLELLHDHDAIVRRRVRKARGEVVKTQGDSFMVAFKELDPALDCAIAIQQDLQDQALAHDTQIRVRIGIHSGEVRRQGRDVFGLNVALAARVAAEARGGEILTSSAVRDMAGENEEVAFGKGRTVRLKGISEAATVYPVRRQAPA